MSYKITRVEIALTNNTTIIIHPTKPDLDAFDVKRAVNDLCGLNVDEYTMTYKRFDDPEDKK